MKSDHHHPHQYATETFCAFVFAVCVLIALLLLAGCEREPAAPRGENPMVQGSLVKFPAQSFAVHGIAVE